MLGFGGLDLRERRVVVGGRLGGADHAEEPSVEVTPVDISDEALEAHGAIVRLLPRRPR